MSVEPAPLRDALDDALQSWAAPARDLMPEAVFCAEPHVWLPECLCRRLRGHAPGHTFDGLPAWVAATATEETSDG